MQITKDRLCVAFLEVQNFMGIEHRVIHLDGRSMWLIGNNAEGKSSLIAALMAIAGSKYIPQQPIREGEKRGLIQLKLEGHRGGEPEEYEITVVFTPSNRTGEMTLKRNGAAVPSPKTVIKELVSRAFFDINEFMRDDKKKRSKVLKQIAGVEEELDAIEDKRAQADRERAVLRAQVDELQVVLKRENRPFTDDDIDTYAKPIDESTFDGQLKELEVKQAQWQKKADDVRDTENIIRNNASDVVRMSNELVEMEAQYEELAKKIAAKRLTIKSFKDANAEYEEKVDRAKKWLADNPRPTSEEIVRKQGEARAHNEKHRTILAYSAKQKEMIDKQEQWEAKDALIYELDEQRDQTLSGSNLSVPGLVITADDILLNGLPLGENINTQSMLDLSVEIAVARNSPLKLAVIKEGSLFSRPNLEKLLSRLRERGIQYIVEYVDPEGGPLEVRFDEQPLI